MDNVVLYSLKNLQAVTGQAEISHLGHLLINFLVFIEENQISAQPL